jgi:hypothetical protein
VNHVFAAPFQLARGSLYFHYFEWRDVRHALREADKFLCFHFFPA